MRISLAHFKGTKIYTKLGQIRRIRTAGTSSLTLLSTKLEMLRLYAIVRGEHFFDVPSQNHRGEITAPSFRFPGLTGVETALKIELLTRHSHTHFSLNEVKCVSIFVCCCVVVGVAGARRRHGLVLGLARPESGQVCVCAAPAGPVLPPDRFQQNLWRPEARAPALVKWSRGRPKFRETGAFSADLEQSEGLVQV